MCKGPGVGAAGDPSLRGPEVYTTCVGDRALKKKNAKSGIKINVYLE